MLQMKQEKYIEDMTSKEKENEDLEEEISAIEVVIIVILFITLGHLISYMCHKRGENYANYYAKTDKELETQEDDENRSNLMSQRRRTDANSGPDYHQF